MSHAPCPHRGAEPVAQFFLSLFVSSTGLVLSPVFLMGHLPLLATGAMVVIVSKTVLVRGARPRTAGRLRF